MSTRRTVPATALPLLVLAELHLAMDAAVAPCTEPSWFALTMPPLPRTLALGAGARAGASSKRSRCDERSSDGNGRFAEEVVADADADADAEEDEDEDEQEDDEDVITSRAPPGKRPRSCSVEPAEEHSSTTEGLLPQSSSTTPPALHASSTPSLATTAPRVSLAEKERKMASPFPL